MIFLSIKYECILQELAQPNAPALTTISEREEDVKNNRNNTFIKRPPSNANKEK